MNAISSVNECCDTSLLLRNLKLKNTNILILGHLNINSIVGNFDHFKVLIENNIDILVLTETKIDASFPNAQFRIDGFSASFRLDRNRFGGGVLIYVREDIPCKQLTKHILPDDIEGIFVEISLRKTKWLLFGGYRPPRQQAEYFLKHVNYALDTYRQTFDKFLLAGDFNIEETDPIMSEFLFKNVSKNLLQQKTCFKSTNNSSCIDLFVTNSPRSFQDTITFASGLSDFHNMILTILNSTFPKVRPKQIVYRKFKNFDLNNFKNEIRTKMQLIDQYETFEEEFLKVLNKHAPLKKKFIRVNHAPYMTKNLRKAIMKRSQLENMYISNSTVENMNKYKKHKNICSKLYKKERKKFYSQLDIKNITDNKLFWKTMKPFLSEKCTYASKISLVPNDNVISDDQELADTFNNFFEHAVDNLGIQEYQSDHNIDINSISDDPIGYAIAKYKNHPSIIMINENVSFESRFSFTAVNEDDIQREILNLNPKKPGTFGNIPTKMLKSSSEICNVALQNIWSSEILRKLYFPNKLKLADITPVYKKKDPTLVENYRPVSVLPSVSKIFERIIQKQFSNYVDEFLSPYLCGFQKGFNTQYALSLIEK